MQPIRRVLDRVQGKAPPGAKRSSEWPRFRRAFMADHPECAVCGRRRGLEAHHVVPFHVAPDLELDQTNLISLCRRCHLIFGHLGAWARVNFAIKTDALHWQAKIEGAR